MSPDRCSHVVVFISHFILMVTVLSVQSSISAAAATDNSWGKRNFVRNEYLDESENDLEEVKNKADVREAVLFSQETPLSTEKRAPGWGKRAPGWGKRSYMLNAVPSFSKNINDDILLDDEDDDNDKIVSAFFKRAPGWGKRNYDIWLDTDAADTFDKSHFLTNNKDANVDTIDDTNISQELLNRIASLSRVTLSSQDLSADKRAPGWGKRNRHTDFNDEGNEAEKRAPGWGKRAPGWGKRFDLNEDDFSDFEKRAPGWGKRAPGWGKRSVPRNCQELKNMKGEDINKVVDRKCGSPRDVNKASRK